MLVKLIDANSLGYAQHHAQDARTGAGIQTQAIAGVLNHLKRNLQHAPKTLNVMVWDDRAQWRYDIHPGYKAGRHRTLEQREARARYEEQRPWIQKALSKFPVVQLTCSGAEADDVAFGMSRQLGLQGHLVELYTADSDWLQLVSQRVSWVNARKPAEKVELDGFTRQTGYRIPAQVAEVKALTGDASDDIDGLPDVADKRAIALLAKYGSLDQVLDAAEDFLGFSAEPKYYHSLMVPEHRETVRRNRRLVDLARGPAIRADSATLVVGEFEELDLAELFHDLGFKQWLDVFGHWTKTLEAAPLTAFDVQSLQRAVRQMPDSWPTAGATT